ncbi:MULTISPECIES: AbrB family transcriptional regulator [Inquilinus]|uniref:Addiction module antidote n=1 Tax=Inquilinus ginsengisoli TaxID=363840 RepID=A0ABU1JMV4_9PROT|nr:AbrB family transcriptional regulator [Inquilinus ginsengisoli]MDR6289662.1 putative addiction module antidote [Inquilinus ginsengisoli]
MVALKLCAIGNSIAAVLPQDVLDRLHAREGDILHLTEVPGGYLLTPDDPDLEIQAIVARKIARKRWNLLRDLAK